MAVADVVSAQGWTKREKVGIMMNEQGVMGLQDYRMLNVVSGRRRIMLAVSAVLYVCMVGRHAEIHTSDGRVYATRSSMQALEEALGDGFVRVERGCIVSARAIHEVTDHICLVNGETIDYPLRHRSEMRDRVQSARRSIVEDFAQKTTPMSHEDYHRHYQSFDSLPCAFCDIEMVFNEQQRAVDWIFRYGNEPLARLEKLPLERLIGSSFSSLFANMDHKWLRLYERATLYGETLEAADYSPEIDTWLKVTCFPTFPGHCACLLFNLDQVRFVYGDTSDEGITRFLSQRR